MFSYLVHIECPTHKKNQRRIRVVRFNCSLNFKLILR